MTLPANGHERAAVRRAQHYLLRRLRAVDERLCPWQHRSAAPQDLDDGPPFSSDTGAVAWIFKKIETVIAAAEPLPGHDTSDQPG